MEKADRRKDNLEKDSRPHWQYFLATSRQHDQSLKEWQPLQSQELKEAEQSFRYVPDAAGNKLE